PQRRRAARGFARRREGRRRAGRHQRAGRRGGSAEADGRDGVGVAAPVYVRLRTEEARPCPQNGVTEASMTMNTGLTVLGALMAAVLAGCSPQATQVRAAVNDKVYTVTPNAMKVQAGMVNAVVTEMKVIERVEEGSGRIDMPAKLTA